MKKIGIISLCLALTLSLGLTLASCGEESTSSGSATAAATTAAATTTTVTTAAPTTAAPTTAVPTATPPAKEPDFTDDFSKVDAKWKLLGEGTEIKDGVLSMPDGVGRKAVYEGAKYKNVMIEVDMVLKGNGNAGFIFAVASADASGPDSYVGYYAGVSTSGAQIGSVNNAWTEIANGSNDAVTDEPIKLKVIFKDGNIELFVDGDSVCEVDNEDFTEGYIGFRHHDTAVTFDNLKVTKLD